MARARARSQQQLQAWKHSPEQAQAQTRSPWLQRCWQREARRSVQAASLLQQERQEQQQQRERALISGQLQHCDPRQGKDWIAVRQ